MNKNHSGFQPVTMQDVARASGVSLSAVSKILKGATNFKDETINKVHQAAKTLNYRPNAMARSIASSSKNPIIGYLAPNMFNCFYADVLDYLEQIFNRQGYELLVCLFHDDPIRVKRYLRFLTEIRASGVIFGSFNAAQSQKDIDTAKQYMSMVSMQADIEDVDRVDVDDYAGTYLAIEHLIKNGHKKIGFLGYDYDLYILSERARAYRQCLADHGIPLRPEYFLDTHQTYDIGYEMTSHLLELPDPPTAIHSFNEYMVPNIYAAIYDHGLRVPDDISVTAFDGIRVSTVQRPRTTTVVGPIEAMAQTASSILLNRIENPDANSEIQHIVFKTKLIERGSVKNIN